MHGFAVGEIHIPEVQAFVGISDLLTVRTPDRVIEEGWRTAKVDLLRLTLSIRVAEVQRILARFVGEIRDPFSVRRPCRISVSDSWRTGQISNIAFFSGRGEDFAPRFEHGPRPRGRNIGVKNLLADDFFKVRPNLREISGNPGKRAAFEILTELPIDWGQEW